MLIPYDVFQIILVFINGHIIHLNLRPPPDVVPRPAVRADQNDPLLLTVAEEGDVKPSLVPAGETDPKLLARLDLPYLLVDLLAQVATPCELMPKVFLTCSGG